MPGRQWPLADWLAGRRDGGAAAAAASVCRLVTMNETVTNVTLHLSISHASLWYWQILSQVR